MKKHTRLLLDGIGSVFDIAPSIQQLQPPKRSVKSRVARAWNRTGDHMVVAISRYDREQKKVK